MIQLYQTHRFKFKIFKLFKFKFKGKQFNIKLIKFK